MLVTSNPAEGVWLFSIEYNGIVNTFAYFLGTCRLHAGDWYSGSFKKGTRQGLGRCIFSNGEKYIGKWRNDKKHGQGKLVCPSGEKYSGMCSKFDLYFSQTNTAISTFYNKPREISWLTLFLPISILIWPLRGETPCNSMSATALGKTIKLLGVQNHCRRVEGWHETWFREVHFCRWHQISWDVGEWLLAANSSRPGNKQGYWGRIEESHSRKKSIFLHRGNWCNIWNTDKSTQRTILGMNIRSQNLNCQSSFCGSVDMKQSSVHFGSCKW